MVLSVLLAVGSVFAPAQAGSALNTSQGHVSFYKHSGPTDDTYTTNPSIATIQFMNAQWLRLMTYSGYWDQGQKLSWYSNAWAYQNSYALYTDPNNTAFAQVIQQHPDWILRDDRGNALYINWGCGGGACPQYAADITNPNGFRAWWIRQAETCYFSQIPRYRGIFIDDVNLDLSRLSDGFGNVATAVDPTTGQLMTNDAWRKYFADFMEQVRAALPGVEIVHNSLWFLDWNDANIQREIQAADWINLQRGVNDPGLTGGTGYWSLDRFLQFVDSVHANGRGVIFDGEAPLSDSDEAREYSVAAYLLVSAGMDLVGDSSQTPTYWWGGFEVDLGEARGARYVWQNLWRRDFAGGMALVNPPGSNPVVVTLPGAFVRINGSVADTITLNAAQGAVLQAPAVLSALQCAPSSLWSGDVGTCTVILNVAAPSGGVTVSLSNNSLLLDVPASVSVSAGATSASFNVMAGTIPVDDSAAVAATLGGTTQTARVTLAGRVRLASMACSPISLRSGGTSSCTVRLTAPAPAPGMVIALSSSGRVLSVPASIVVPTGADSASFGAGIGLVRNSRTAAVTAKSGAVSVSVTFHLSL